MDHPEAVESMPQGLGQRVLVVEDEVSVWGVLGDLIRGGGYEVSFAKNGFEALELLRGELPSMILVDWIMPEMGGAQLLRTLDQDPRLARIPRAVLTGVNDPTIRLRETGHVLYKPIDPHALLALLHRSCTPPLYLPSAP
jgi:CheY-like chemotaxis protein